MMVGPRGSPGQQSQDRRPMALSRSPVRAAAGTLTALHAPELTVRAIRGDRETYCSRLSVLPVRGGVASGVGGGGGAGGVWWGGWGEEAPPAAQPPVVIHALDHVSVQLELGDA